MTATTAPSGANHCLTTVCNSSRWQLWDWCCLSVWKCLERALTAAAPPTPLTPEILINRVPAFLPVFTLGASFCSLYGVFELSPVGPRVGVFVDFFIYCIVLMRSLKVVVSVEAKLVASLERAAWQIFRLRFRHWNGCVKRGYELFWLRHSHWPFGLRKIGAMLELVDHISGTSPLIATDCLFDLCFDRFARRFKYASIAYAGQISVDGA